MTKPKCRRTKCFNASRALVQGASERNFLGTVTRMFFFLEIKKSEKKEPSGRIDHFSAKKKFNRASIDARNRASVIIAVFDRWGKMARYVDFAGSFIILLLMVHLEQLVLQKRGIVREPNNDWIPESLEIIRPKLFETRLITARSFQKWRIINF